VFSFVPGVDPAYVAAHQVMRFFCIAVTMPLIAKWLSQGKAEK
jgi:uncharacterized membrane protein AbrB (regulator of aidB expression)